MRRRSIHCFLNTFVLIACLFFSCTSTTHGQAYFDEDLQCAPDHPVYDWERLNYYEILGFTEEERIRMKMEVSPTEFNKAIRKKYRKQAQQWHPDKIQASASLTQEEINARFAKIAQAYKTLHDPSKRNAYNRFLENCQYLQDRGGGGNSNHHGRQGGRRGGQSSYQQHNSNNYQSNNQYQNHRRQQNQQQNHNNNNAKPSLEQKSRELLMDPMTGTPILRETTYQEFQAEKYYRILVQDFLVESMDAWGNTNYRPMYPEPQVIEEGPLLSENNSKERQRSNPAIGNTLQSGDVLRIEEYLLSQNERYRARLNQGCQLVIETPRNLSGRTPEIKMVWSSNNDMPYSSTTECFLGFAHGLLFIAAGTPESPQQVYWQSTLDTNNGMDPTDEFVARLEDDGKLVVYKVDVFSSLGKRTNQDSDALGTCVYATGPLGCIRLSGLVRDAKELMSSLLQSEFAHDMKEFVQEAKEFVTYLFTTEGDSKDWNLASKLSGIARNVKEFVQSFFHKTDEWNYKENSKYGEYYKDEEEEFHERLLRKAKHLLNKAYVAVPHMVRNAKEFMSSAFESLNSDSGKGRSMKGMNYGRKLFRKLPPNLRIALKTINRKRKSLEKYLDQRTLEFVQDLHGRWKKRQKRSSR